MNVLNLIDGKVRVMHEPWVKDPAWQIRPADNIPVFEVNTWLWTVMVQGR